MKGTLIGFALIIIIGVLVPFTAGNFAIRLATDIVIFAILASSWNIIGGYTGYASFGNIVFFGVGAYATAVLMSKAGLGVLSCTYSKRTDSRSLRFCNRFSHIKIKGSLLCHCNTGSG